MVKIFCCYFLTNHKSGFTLNMDLGLRVLHEFGIFSTFVSGRQIPSRFSYRASGPEISFEVPWHPNNSTTIAFNLCVVLSRSKRSSRRFLWTGVDNKTKRFMWSYHVIPKYQKSKEYITWLSLWRCGNLLEAGDQIVISINNGAPHTVVEECRVSFIYEDDE